jgi:hypothetical protein
VYKSNCLEIEYNRIIKKPNFQYSMVHLPVKLMGKKIKKNVRPITDLGKLLIILHDIMNR